MKRVLERISAKQQEFTRHPFFQRLERNEPAEHTMAFIAAPCFFVLTFQDILRMNATRIREPEMRKIAEHHQQEDLGHDLWFLEDMATVEGAPRTAAWMFSKDHLATRDVAYELISEVFLATDDRVRIVLVLVLEATGHIMFTKMSEYLERIEFDRELKYFSRKHLDVELAHELFDDKVDSVLERIVLSPTVLDEALALVERAFAAQWRMLDAFDARIAASMERSSGTAPAQQSL